jgi:hypothetical protein
MQSTDHPGGIHHDQDIDRLPNHLHPKTLGSALPRLPILSRAAHGFARPTQPEALDHLGGGGQWRDGLAHSQIVDSDGADTLQNRCQKVGIGGVRPSGWTELSYCFDRLPGVLIFELLGAEIAQGRV